MSMQKIEKKNEQIEIVNDERKKQVTNGEIA